MTVWGIQFLIFNVFYRYLIKQREVDIWRVLRRDCWFSYADAVKSWETFPLFLYQYIEVLQDKGLVLVSSDYNDGLSSYRLTTKGEEFQRALIKKRMDKLLKNWNKWVENSGVIYSSLMENYLEHPSHKEVLKIGELALPALLAELQKQEGEGLTALAILPTLTQITKMAPPVEIKDGFVRMNIQAMIEWWLEWGKERGIHF